MTIEAMQEVPDFNRIKHAVLIALTFETVDGLTLWARIGGSLGSVTHLRQDLRTVLETLEYEGTIRREKSARSNAGTNPDIEHYDYALIW